MMRVIKELLDVDFFVYPKSLSDKGEEIISNYIKADKEKMRCKYSAKKKVHTRFAQA